MKTKLITVTAVLLIFVGALASCKKDISDSQLGLYVETYPLRLGESRKLKVEFIDRERMAFITPVLDPEGVVKEVRNEYGYKIRGQKIELIHLSQGTIGRRTIFFFRWINNYKFEMNRALAEGGDPSQPVPNTIFERQLTND